MTMRVLHVLDSLDSGGIEKTFLHVLAELGARRNEPVQTVHEVLALSGGPLEAAYRATADDVHVVRRPTEIDRVLDRGFDIVHALLDRAAHRVLPRVMARSEAATMYGKGYDLAALYEMEGAFNSAADRALLRASDAVTFTTDALAARYEVRPERASVLGKAVGLDDYAAIPDPAMDAPDQIVCVANLHPGKRVRDLILALRIVRAHIPVARLSIVGGDRVGEAARLRALADRLDLREAVDVNDGDLRVASQIGRSRVLALASEREGVPTVLLEAMAAGRPVVATRVGHVESIVDDGSEGYLVNPGDIPALAERLVTLLGDRSLAARMGAAGRVRATAHDVRQVASRWLAAAGRVRDLGEGAAHD